RPDGRHGDPPGLPGRARPPSLSLILRRRVMREDREAWVCSCGMARTERSDPPIAPPRVTVSRARRAGRGLGALIVALGMIAVLAGGASLAYYRWCQGAGGPQQPVSFQVPHGATDA